MSEKKTLLGRAIEREREDIGHVTSDFTQVDTGVLDEELEDRCVPKFEDGHPQSAIQSAMIVLEERVREKGDYSPNSFGTNLMKDAFHMDDGPLAFGESKSEKVGVMFLYRGVIQALRNPASHRPLEEADEGYARDVIHTVNLLLRLLELNHPE